jgi:hypothetical protein
MQWVVMGPASSGTQASAKSVATGSVSGGIFKLAHRRRVLLGIVLTFSCHAQANLGVNQNHQIGQNSGTRGLWQCSVSGKNYKQTTSLARLTGHAQDS